MRLFEFDVDVVSERGTDAKILHWSPDDVVDPVVPPDGSILWDGDAISVVNFSIDTGGSAQIQFLMELPGGDPTEASAEYDQLGIKNYVSWLDTDPSDNQYWMRVLNIGSSNPTLKIFDSSNYRPLTTPFQMFGAGPIISVDTFGDTPPSNSVASIRIDICKDSGGLPDGNWATRSIRLEAISTAVTDNVISGGFGSGVNEYLVSQGYEISRIKNLGIPDKFIEHGSRDALLTEVGLTPEALAKAAIAMLRGEKRMYKPAAG